MKWLIPIVDCDGFPFSVCACLGGAWLIYAFVVAVVSLITSQRWPSIDFRGKRVFITGGSTGIGLEMAKNFASRGAKVIISARRDDVLREAVAEINFAASAAAVKSELTVYPAGYVIMDVSDEAAVLSGLEAAARFYNGERSGTSENKASSLVKRRRSVVSRPTTPRGGSSVQEQPIDILVCNAGYSYPARFLNTPPVEAKRQMEINFFGCVNVIRGALPSMFAFQEKNPNASPGRIVCISSLAAIVPAAGFTIYAPTKAALVAFCHSLDMESSAKGVRAQVVFPPDVSTPGFDQENLVKSEECKQICAFGGNAPFTASQMGKAIVDSLALGGGFSITLGLDGWLLTRLGSMMQPGTFWTQFSEMVGLAAIARLIGCIFAFIHYRIVRNVIKKERRR